MKIALAQIECIAGRPDLNFLKIKEAIQRAKEDHAEMVVFPENSVPGYLIGDQWEEQAYLRDCVSYNEDIRDLSDGIYVVFGSIKVNFDEAHTDGRPVIYNALYVAYSKEFINLKPLFAYTQEVYYHAKALLPNYREFEEPRHIKSSLNAPFYMGPDYFTPVDINGVDIGFTICEEGWDNDYEVKPITEYVKRGADLIINISCSPHSENKNRARDRVFGQGHAKGNCTPLIYVNAVGIQNNGKTVYTFDGSSAAYNTLGETVLQAPMFEEGIYYVQYNGDINSGTLTVLPTGYEETYQALKYGTEKFLKQCGTNKVVIGASGGIDSCVSAALIAQIVGPENLLLVNMPSRYNSDLTRDIACNLAKKIGCYYTILPIENSVALTKSQIDGLEINSKRFSAYLNHKTLSLSPLHLENIQARDRSARILAAVASAWGGVYTCNGNKTEITVGYCTLSGDNTGFLAPLGDLWKQHVYGLGRHMNKTYPVIPEEAFTVVPSAELSSEQNVNEGKGDPIVYWYHDKLFESWQQWWHRATPEENLKWYLDGNINEKLGITNGNVYKLLPTVAKFTDDLERWYKLFKGMSVVKRVQSPPIVCLTRRAFGFDYRDYIGEAYFTREYINLKRGALSNENRP